MLLDKKEKLDTRLPSVVVSADTALRLKHASQLAGISVSELMRRAIDLFLSEIANEISNQDVLVSVSRAKQDQSK